MNLVNSMKAIEDKLNRIGNDKYKSKTEETTPENNVQQPETKIVVIASTYPQIKNEPIVNKIEEWVIDNYVKWLSTQNSVPKIKEVESDDISQERITNNDTIAGVHFANHSINCPCAKCIQLRQALLLRKKNKQLHMTLDPAMRERFPIKNSVFVNPTNLSAFAENDIDENDIEFEDISFKDIKSLYSECGELIFVDHVTSVHAVKSWYGGQDTFNILLEKKMIAIDKEGNVYHTNGTIYRCHGCKDYFKKIETPPLQVHYGDVPYIFCSMRCYKLVNTAYLRSIGYKNFENEHINTHIKNKENKSTPPPNILLPDLSKDKDKELWRQQDPSQSGDPLFDDNGQY